MGLHEELEETKRLLEEINGVNENETTEEVIENDNKSEEIIEETVKEEQKAETEETPEKKDESEKAEEKIDNSAYARMRRENASLKKQLEEKQKEAEKVEEKEPFSEEAEVIAELIRDTKIRKAELEFVALEQDFSKNISDYEDVSMAYKTALYQSLSVLNPNKNHVELLQDTKNAILSRASEYVRSGLDPIEEMYKDAKRLNLSIPTKEETKQDNVKEIKADLDKISKNKARNAGMAAASGSGSDGVLTKSHAASLSVAEWSKLPAEEKRRLMYS